MPNTQEGKGPVAIRNVLPEVVQETKIGEYAPSPGQRKQEQQRQSIESPQKIQYPATLSESEIRLYEKIISHPTRNVQMWIRPEAVKVDPDSKQVTIFSVNNFCYDWLKQPHYKSYLLGCVSDVLGEGYELNFTVDKELVLFDNNPKVVGTSSKPVPRKRQTRLEKKVFMPYECKFKDIGWSDGNERALTTLKKIYANIVLGRHSNISDKAIALIGDSGVGKTYVASALANTLSEKGFDSWCLNLNNLSVKLHNTRGEFNRKLKPPEGIKLAIFDDVDGCFSSGGIARYGVQRGFLKCLNLIRNSSGGTQIILTGKKEPRELARKLRKYASSIKDEENTRKWVATNLAGRLEGATRVYLDHPSRSSLRGFVSHLVRHNCRGRKELETFLDFYVETLSSEQIRLSEIGGDIDTIKTYLENHGNPRLSPEIAIEALRYQESFFDPKNLPDKIIEIMLEEVGISKEQLLAKKRGSKTIADFRHKVVYVLRRLLKGRSSPEIAEMVNRTHTTILNSEKKVRRECSDEVLKKLVMNVEGKLKQRGIKFEK